MISSRYERTEFSEEIFFFYIYIISVLITLEKDGRRAIETSGNKILTTQEDVDIFWIPIYINIYKTRLKILPDVRTFRH